MNNEQIADALEDYRKSGATVVDNALLDWIDEAIAHLRQPASAPAAVAEGWQPIETAPKDKQILLAVIPSENWPEGAVSQGYWQKGWEDSVDDMGCNDGFVDCNHQIFSAPRRFGNPAYRTEGRQPTHWMPLPSAPGIAHPSASTALPAASDQIANLQKALTEERNHRIMAQKALNFWLPRMSEHYSDEVCQRISDDAYTLYGYEGEDEKTAEDFGWLNIAAPTAQAGASDGYLCRAWGESDLPVAEFCRDMAGVREFIVREWLGDSEDPQLPEIMAGIEGHEFKDEGMWKAEFEIGGVSVDHVPHFIFPAISTPTGAAIAGSADAKDAARWRAFLKALRTHIPGPGFGTRIKVVKVCPMYGDEEKVDDIERLIDAAIAASAAKGGAL